MVEIITKSAHLGFELLLSLTKTKDRIDEQTGYIVHRCVDPVGSKPKKQKCYLPSEADHYLSFKGIFIA